MKYKLEDLFDLQMGKTPARNNPEYWNSADNKWISIGDLSKCGKYITNTKEYLSDTAVEESGISLIPENTVVMSFKLSIGKTAITSEPMYSNEAIMSFRDKHVVPILPDYLYYMFSAKDWDEGTNKAVMGKTLNKATLAKVTIDVHSPTEQKKIVDTLDKVASAIDARRQQLSVLDDLIKARFVEMFGDPVANTLEWKTALLREVTSKIGSGATPRGGKESYQAEGITLIRSMNVHDGRFEYKDLAHITDEQAAQLDNVSVQEGDVFINITGASVARSCIVPKDTLPARVNQHVAIIRCVRDLLNPTFANNMFLNDRFKEQLLDIGESGGATRQAITKQQLEGLTVILPPMNQQEEFASFVAQIDKSKSAIQKSLDETQILFDSLMQKYFG